MNFIAALLISGYGTLQGKILLNRWGTQPLKDERNEMVTRLAKEMGYNSPLDLRTWRGKEESAALGSRLSLLPSLLMLKPQPGELGEVFIYAHELAHLTKEHFLQSALLVLGTSALSRFLLHSLPRPWAYSSIALVVPVAYRVFLSHQRDCEKEADLIACAHVSQKEIGSVLHQLNSFEWEWEEESEWSRNHPKKSERLAYLKEEFYKKGEQPPITFNNQILSLETSNLIRDKIKHSSWEITLIDTSNIELREDGLKITTFSGTDATLSLSKEAISDDKGLIKLVEEGLRSPLYLKLPIATKENIVIETLRVQFRSMLPHAEKYDFDKMVIIPKEKMNNYEVRIPFII